MTAAVGLCHFASLVFDAKSLVPCEMENPEEILHSLEEFSKLRPKDIPRELEEYLCFVAKTGDPIFQWATIKTLFREKLVNVITDFYETCPSIEIPPCPNVDVFNYDTMKNFILEKLETFANAPFTIQRISELLTTPRKEYNRIDKYMRALEKNILVVSTVEPGNRRNNENGDGFINGIENEHSNNDINVEEMDEGGWEHDSTWGATGGEVPAVKSEENATCSDEVAKLQDNIFVSIEPVVSNACVKSQEDFAESTDSVTITAVPAAVQKRRDSIEPIVEADVNTDAPMSSSKDAEMTETMRENETVTTCEKQQVDLFCKTEEVPSLQGQSTSLEAIQQQTEQLEAMDTDMEAANDLIAFDNSIEAIDSTTVDETSEKLLLNEPDVPTNENIIKTDTAKVEDTDNDKLESRIEPFVTSEDDNYTEKCIAEFQVEEKSTNVLLECSESLAKSPQDYLTTEDALKIDDSKTEQFPEEITTDSTDKDDATPVIDTLEKPSEPTEFCLDETLEKPAEILENTQSLLSPDKLDDIVADSEKEDEQILLESEPDVKTTEDSSDLHLVDASGDVSQESNKEEEVSEVVEGQSDKQSPNEEFLFNLFK